MSAAVVNTPNSIGYMELAYAIANSMNYARMVNKAGKTISDNGDSVNAAMSDPAVVFTPQLTATIVDGSMDGAWPITGYTYIILRTTSMTDSVKAKKILEFLKWTQTLRMHRVLLLPWAIRSCPILSARLSLPSWPRSPAMASQY